MFVDHSWTARIEIDTLCPTVARYLFESFLKAELSIALYPSQSLHHSLKRLSNDLRLIGCA